uniref:Uncharacterized protein n=1 Tax=Caenorhabditis japonica TaxID=281687 RepID=A0A8R1EDQ8_CAEJA
MYIRRQNEPGSFGKQRKDFLNFPGEQFRSLRFCTIPQQVSLSFGQQISLSHRFQCLLPSRCPADSYKS